MVAKKQMVQKGYSKADALEDAMLRKAVKPKLLGLFIAICTVGIIIVGYLFNVLQPFLI